MMPHFPDQETAQLSERDRITSEELIELGLKIPSVRAEVERAAATERPTSFRDDTPPTPTGAQPVPQYDRSLWGHVPKWALGAMIAGPSVGATAVGMGYGAQLFFDSITTEGIVMVGVIVSGAVVFVGSLSSLIKRAGAAASSAPAPVTNHFHGGVTIEKNTLVQNEARALSFQRNRITDGGTS